MMHDPDAHPPESLEGDHETQPRHQKISIPAVLGVMLFVVGAIAFGILGPRMDQRVQMVPGKPLEHVVKVVIQDHFLAMGRLRQEPMHPEEARSILQKRMGSMARLPELATHGWELIDAQEPWKSPQDAPKAIRLTYAGPQEGLRRKLLIVHLLQEPGEWFHFDELGRQVPLGPGSRIDQVVPLEAGSSLGVSVVCFPSHAAIVTALDLRDASEAADAILGGESPKDDQEGPHGGTEGSDEEDSLVFSLETHSNRRFQPARMSWYGLS